MTRTWHMTKLGMVAAAALLASLLAPAPAHADGPFQGNNIYCDTLDPGEFTCYIGYNGGYGPYTTTWHIYEFGNYPTGFYWSQVDSAGGYCTSGFPTEAVADQYDRYGSYLQLTYDFTCPA